MQISIRISESHGLRRLREWADANLPKGSLLDAVHAMCSKRASFTQAYEFEAAYRTTNHVDRLMNRQDLRLYAMHYYFHGSLASASMTMRSSALLWNFHTPTDEERVRCIDGRAPRFPSSMAFRTTNWLHDLLIASSMGGRRSQSRVES